MTAEEEAFVRSVIAKAVIVALAEGGLPMPQRKRSAHIGHYGKFGIGPAPRALAFEGGLCNAHAAESA